MIKFQNTFFLILWWFIHSMIQTHIHISFYDPTTHTSFHSFYHPTTHHFIHSITQPPIHHSFYDPTMHTSFILSPNHPYINSFYHPTTHTSIHSITQSPIHHSFYHPTTHRSIHSITQPPIHQFIHPFYDPSTHLFGSFTSIHLHILCVTFQDPGRIWKGKRMPGHMGDDWRVLKGLRVCLCNSIF